MTVSVQRRCLSLWKAQEQLRLAMPSILDAGLGYVDLHFRMLPIEVQYSRILALLASEDDRQCEQDLQGDEEPSHAPEAGCHDDCRLIYPFSSYRSA